MFVLDLEKIKTLSEQQPDIRIQVQIAIIIGDDMDFSSSRKITVPSDYSFYQALENISASGPEYKWVGKLKQENFVNIFNTWQFILNF